jgi:hypothetical protein
MTGESIVKIVVISAPEDVGRAPGCCEQILRRRAERGIVLDVQKDSTR